jgi:hypothetical protein
MLWVYVDAAPAFPFPKQVKKYGKKVLQANALV